MLLLNSRLENGVKLDDGCSSSSAKSDGMFATLKEDKPQRVSQARGGQGSLRHFPQQDLASGFIHRVVVGVIRVHNAFAGLAGWHLIF